LGFDPVWFGVTFIVNMEMAYLTPPFGYNLFYLRSIAPEGVQMADIYRSVIPFIALQRLCLILVSIFPRIILWLPRKLV
jgi:TRAP-type mannitol/chloroaromatic compound transport system permease large subunit